MKLSWVCLVAMLVMACNQKTQTTPPAPTPTPTERAWFATVIDYSELDGCNWMLELSDGKKLQPVNLGDEYKRKGLKLFITYKIYDGVSTCMAGKMVTLTSVDFAKEDKQR